jgi:hypothetical protein
LSAAPTRKSFLKASFSAGSPFAGLARNQSVAARINERMVLMMGMLAGLYRGGKFEILLAMS